MELRHLETFLAIAEAGTLTAAADRLYKTQGAVSHDLRSLEREVGSTLIDRSGQRIRLTEAGDALLPHARELMLRVREIDLTMNRVRLGDVGIVRVGALPSIAELIVDHLVPYRFIAPDVRFTLFSETQSVLVEWLLDGRLDLAVAEPEISDELVTVDLGVEAIVVMLRTDHPLASRRTLRPEDLVNERFIGCIRGLGNSRPAERFFSSLGTYPDPVVEVQDHRIMRDLIRRNVGFGLMTARTADEAHSPDLVAIPTDPGLERHVALLRSARRILPPAVLDFNAYLSSHWGLPDPLPPVQDHGGSDPIVAHLVPVLRGD